MCDVKLEHVIIGAQLSPQLGRRGTETFVHMSRATPSRQHDRLLKRFDCQWLSALLALVNAFWLVERAIEAVRAELSLRQTEQMEADSTAAVHRTDTSAVAVHEALVELSLHK